jgi:hypothetical protein
MNAFVKGLLARERELLAQQEKIESELMHVRALKGLHAIKDDGFSSGGSNGQVNATRLIEEAIEKRHGQFTHFDIKSELDRNYPTRDIKVKQISNALYKFRKRKPPLIKIANQGTGQQPHSYERFKP